MFLSNQNKIIDETKHTVSQMKRVSKIHYRSEMLSAILGRSEKLVQLIAQHMSVFSDDDMREVEAKWLTNAISDLSDDEAIELVNNLMKITDYSDIVDGNWIERYKSEGISADLVQTYGGVHSGHLYHYSGLGVVFFTSLLRQAGKSLL